MIYKDRRRSASRINHLHEYFSVWYGSCVSTYASVHYLIFVYIVNYIDKPDRKKPRTLYGVLSSTDKQRYLGKLSDNNLPKSDVVLKNERWDWGWGWGGGEWVFKIDNRETRMMSSKLKRIRSDIFTTNFVSEFNTTFNTLS